MNPSLFPFVGGLAAGITRAAGPLTQALQRYAPQAEAMYYRMAPTISRANLGFQRAYKTKFGNKVIDSAIKTAIDPVKRNAFLDTVESGFDTAANYLDNVSNNPAQYYTENYYKTYGGNQ